MSMYIPIFSTKKETVLQHCPQFYRSCKFVEFVTSTSLIEATRFELATSTSLM